MPQNTATVYKNRAELEAITSDGRRLRSFDPATLADMLLSSGVSVDRVRVMDEPLGEYALCVDQKAALLARMSEAATAT